MVQVVSRCIQNGVLNCIFGLKDVQTRSLQPLFKAFSTSRTLHGLALQLKDFLRLARKSSLIIVARFMSSSSCGMSYGSPWITPHDGHREGQGSAPRSHPPRTSMSSAKVWNLETKRRKSTWKKTKTWQEQRWTCEFIVSPHRIYP